MRALVLTRRFGFLNRLFVIPSATKNHLPEANRAKILHYDTFRGLGFSCAATAIWTIPQGKLVDFRWFGIKILRHFLILRCRNALARHARH